MQFWIFQVAIVGSEITMGGLSASAGETEGSQLTITTPRHGEIVGSTVELSYDLEKGTKGDHVHAWVDGPYQKRFEGTHHRHTPGNIRSRSKWPIMTMIFLSHRIPSRLR